jgi:hypothetical protein
VLLGSALVKARLGDAPGFWSAYGRLPRRMVGWYTWKTGITVGEDVARGVQLLEHVRAAARGLRRPEIHMLAVFLRRDGGANPT